MSRSVRFAPLALLMLIVAALIWRLATPADTNVHSTLEGNSIPAFNLPAAVPGSVFDHRLGNLPPRLSSQIGLA